MFAACAHHSNMMRCEVVMGGVAANTHSKARQRFQHSSLSTDVVVAHFAGCEQGTIASRIALYECGRQRRRWAFRVSGGAEQKYTAAQAPRASPVSAVRCAIPSLLRKPITQAGERHSTITREISTIVHDVGSGSDAQAR